MSRIKTPGAMVLAGVVWVAGGAACAKDPISTANYTCADDKTIAATYYPDEVALVFGDGREMTLPQVMSGSGTRYANEDESLVFWSKGDMAFVTEGSDENVTYADCVAK